jgi:hypothetical protein
MWVFKGIVYNLPPFSISYLLFLCNSIILYVIPNIRTTFILYKFTRYLHSMTALYRRSRKVVVSNRGPVSCLRRGSRLVISPQPIYPPWRVPLARVLHSQIQNFCSNMSRILGNKYLSWRHHTRDASGPSINLADNQNSTVVFLPEGKKGFPGSRERASTVSYPHSYLRKLREHHFRKFVPPSLTLFSNLQGSPFLVISLSTQRKKFEDKF